MSNNQTVSIMIAGVGGQGTLLASRVLGNAAMKKDFDVKMSEVHGMAQRGGSVVPYVRFGKEVASPVIDRGQADVLLSFEQLEAARYLPFVRHGGLLITNTQKINPMTVVSGAVKYPADILDKLAQVPVRLETLDALSLAREAGNEKAVNIVLIGRFAKCCDLFTPEELLESVKVTVPAKLLDINLKAFEYGYRA